MHFDGRIVEFAQDRFRHGRRAWRDDHVGKYGTGVEEPIEALLERGGLDGRHRPARRARRFPERAGPVGPESIEQLFLPPSPSQSASMPRRLGRPSPSSPARLRTRSFRASREASVRHQGGTRIPKPACSSSTAPSERKR